MNQFLIAAQNINKQFDAADKGSAPLHVLSSVNLAVRAGETLAIVGASGSGKTTLLSLLAGLDTPTSGSIHIDGEDITKLNEKRRSLVRAQKLGFVFQDFLLLPHMTVLENVMLPLEMREEKNARGRALQDLARVGLQNKTNNYPNQLSGGEQQRTAIIRAFVTRPQLLFADEPSGNLDDKIGTQVADLLFELNRQNNTTLILVTHDMRLARRCASTYALRGGTLAKSSSSTQTN